MPRNSILDSTSFIANDDAGRKAVCDLFANTFEQGQPLDLNSLPLFNIQDPATGKERVSPSIAQRNSLSRSLAFYTNQLDKTDLTSFIFLNEQQQVERYQNLQFTFYLISAQYLLDEIEGRRQNLQKYAEQLKQCAFLIHELRKAMSEITPATILASASDDDSEKCVKYLGLTLVAPTIVDALQAVSTGDKEVIEQWMGGGKTAIIKHGMGKVNEVRLYWVWAGNFLSTVISLLPDNFTNKQQAQNAVSAPSLITGCMSWVLYYARFGINWLLVLKHTVPSDSWMTKEEQQIPFWERFTTQLDLRKFTLLNDSIWATANMACFFWLTGQGTLGYLGNVLTAVLLLMDVCLTIWRFSEESTQHNLEMKRYDESDPESDISKLKNAIRKAESEKERTMLEEHLKALFKAKAQCEFEWKYKKYGLINDLAYSGTLLVAFTLMCCFLLPGAAFTPEIVLVLSVAGAALCFVLTAISAATSGYIDIAKSEETGQTAKAMCQKLLEEFDTIDEEKHPFEKRLMYLDMKQLWADTDYQSRLAHFQKIKLLRSILVDILIPPLIFVSFTFFPLSIGLAAFAAGVVLASVTSKMLNALEPKAIKVPDFDEAEFVKFELNPKRKLSDLKIDVKPEKQQGTTFFSPKPCGLSGGKPPVDGDQCDGAVIKV